MARQGTGIVTVSAVGLSELVRDLDRAPVAIRRAAANVINRTATWSKQDLIRSGSAATGLRSSMLRVSHRIERANASKNLLLARVIPSSAGIDVPEYRGWRHAPTGNHPTRHRILVRWPGGWKTAAGFVNPFGKQRAPLSTIYGGYRLPKGRVITAMGLSAAALFKVIADNAYRERVGDRLRDEFVKEEIKLAGGNL